jgi:serine/threonine protein kinase
MEARLESEIRFLAAMDHPGVCKCHDFIQDSINCYIVLELGPPRTIADLIIEGNISESNCKQIFRGLVEALSYVHKLGIAHRDIKPENVLVDEKYRIKLIDFGLACQNFDKIKSSSGSLAYQAPEILKREPFDGIIADMWALGVVLYYMVYGVPPWTRRRRNEVIRQITEAEFIIPIDATESLRSLICGLMTVDVEKRMTMEEVLSSEWLKGVVPEYKSSSSCVNPLTSDKINIVFQVEHEEKMAALDPAVKKLLEKAKKTTAPSRLFRARYNGLCSRKEVIMKQNGPQPGVASLGM